MIAAYLDSCIVIYFVEGKIAPPTEATERAFAISDLVRMECLVKPVAENNTRLVDRFDRYFATVDSLELHRVVFERAAELRAKHRLKTPDAIHLAAALEHGCDEFWTNDSRLKGAGSDIAFRVLP